MRHGDDRTWWPGRPRVLLRWCGGAVR